MRIVIISDIQIVFTRDSDQSHFKQWIFWIDTDPPENNAYDHRIREVGIYCQKRVIEQGNIFTIRLIRISGLYKLHCFIVIFFTQYLPNYLRKISYNYIKQYVPTSAAFSSQLYIFSSVLFEIEVLNYGSIFLSLQKATCPLFKIR